MNIRRCIIIVLAVFLFGCAPRAITNQDAKGETIVCFGDSITEGVGAARSESYPFFLDQMVDRPVVNAGIGGNTTAEALKRIEEDVFAQDPGIVIVILGGNDFLRKLPKAQAVANMETIVSRLQARGAMVVMASVKIGPLYDIYTKEFKAIAREKGAVFVPNILKGIMTNPKLKFDRIHPNGEGYKIMAERIYEAIKPYL